MATTIPINLTTLTAVTTTVAAGSDGLTLPQSTLSVASTTGFAASGAVLVQSDAGPQVVTYTGRTGGTLTGCSGGIGTLATGNSVVRATLVGPTSNLSGETSFTLSLNRNVGSTPIDTLALGSLVVTAVTEFSLDGGATFGGPGTSIITVAGGAIVPTKGPNAGVEQTVTSDSGDIPGDPASATRQARSWVCPAQTFSVSGSLVLNP